MSSRPGWSAWTGCWSARSGWSPPEAPRSGPTWYAASSSVKTAGESRHNVTTRNGARAVGRLLLLLGLGFLVLAGLLGVALVSRTPPARNQALPAAGQVIRAGETRGEI